MAHIWMSHGTHVDELWHSDQRSCASLFLCLPSPKDCSTNTLTHTLSFICVIHMCDINLFYLCHDSCIYATWLSHKCDLTLSYVRHDSFMCAARLMHMCDMAHSYVWHDSFICVPWLIHMCAMTHSYVCHDSFICVPWLIHMCALQNPHAERMQVGQETLRETSTARTYWCNTAPYILTFCTQRDTPRMGWLRLVGPTKVQVSFVIIGSFIGLFCERNQQFNRSYSP